MTQFIRGVFAPPQREPVSRRGPLFSDRPEAEPLNTPTPEQRPLIPAVLFSLGAIASVTAVGMYFISADVIVRHLVLSLSIVLPLMALRSAGQSITSNTQEPCHD